MVADPEGLIRSGRDAHKDPAWLTNYVSTSWISSCHIGTAALTAVLAYLGDASHLNGVVSVGLASLILGRPLSPEHAVENASGDAFFGAVRVKRY